MPIWDKNCHLHDTLQEAGVIQAIVHNSTFTLFTLWLSVTQ